MGAVWNWLVESLVMYTILSVSSPSVVFAFAFSCCYYGCQSTVFKAKACVFIFMTVNSTANSNLSQTCLGVETVTKVTLTDGPPEILHQYFCFFNLRRVDLTADHGTERHLVSQLLRYSQGQCGLKGRGAEM